MLGMAQQAADLLEKQGISCTVVNPRFIKPLDTELLKTQSRSADVVVTFEDHTINSGFGSMVGEALDVVGSQLTVVKVGWPDLFVEHGAIDLLRKKYGVTPEAAAERTLAVLRGT